MEYCEMDRSLNECNWGIYFVVAMESTKFDIIEAVLD